MCSIPAVLMTYLEVLTSYMLIPLTIPGLANNSILCISYSCGRSTFSKKKSELLPYQLHFQFFQHTWRNKSTTKTILPDNITILRTSNSLHQFKHIYTPTAEPHLQHNNSSFHARGFPTVL